MCIRDRVTANGNFKILADGSIETTNGKFTGEIDSSKGKIGGFERGNGRIGSVADSHGSGGEMCIRDRYHQDQPQGERTRADGHRDKRCAAGGQV